MELLITELIRKGPLLRSRGFFMPFFHLFGDQEIRIEEFTSDHLRNYLKELSAKQYLCTMKQLLN